ncbi:MAG: general secretion pathway protein GspB [Oryzomonas sp.]|uniref:general secretion pathway protein GspB n=1 Tax=Oryzomonas sp. TaxID=2855186 RepID=UPI00284B627B|nr:general secretion pathway protein GspB [Oryzomonas sp.]MDR3581406.1 general secretion pathway protein GspB [Oryzomonas sp.]
MSSILKALKKLEEEKSARTPDALKIDTEILRGGNPSRFPYRNVTLLAVLFFACGSALTYLYVRQGAHQADNLPPRTAQHTPSGAAEPRKTMPAEGDLSRTVQVEPPRSRAKNAPASTLRAKHLKNSRATASAVTGQPKPGIAATPPAAPPPATPVKRIPTIRVDGIAYHFGSADSLAVVNGNTVYAGAIVEGVKVEEIGKDRIRFNYEGERFEVPLGKSN